MQSYASMPHSSIISKKMHFGILYCTSLPPNRNAPIQRASQLPIPFCRTCPSICPVPCSSPPPQHWVVYWTCSVFIGGLTGEVVHRRCYYGLLYANSEFPENVASFFLSFLVGPDPIWLCSCWQSLLGFTIKKDDSVHNHSPSSS